MIPASFSPLVNHLWQSTLFAGAAVLLALLLKQNHAQARYRLWLAASIKFLIPFSLLVSAGRQIEWRNAPQVAHPISEVVEQIGQPFALEAPVTTPTRVGGAQLLLGLWLCGSAFILARWLVRWRRIHSARLAGSPLHIGAPLPVVCSPAAIEPGVFGIFRPVLLLPAGIAERLTPPQLQAILAHELCHVRRRDNLAAAIHMAVEALFWFHPLVWWIGARMVEERERACDEYVLREGAAAAVYAEGILNVCRHYLESPLVCASGVTGSNLKKRIEQILDSPLSRRLTPARKLLLAGAAAVAVALPVAVGMLSAQTKAAEPAFEVASVKPGDPNARGLRISITPGGGVNIENTVLRSVITVAYDIQNYQLGPVPGWVDSERFTIVGKGPASSGEGAQRMTNKEEADVARARLRTLLAERFHLQIRHDFKDSPVLVLEVAKNGHRMKSAEPHGGLSIHRAGEMIGEGAPMSSLATMLGMALGRPVLDETGLKGGFDFKLEWTPDLGSGGLSNKPGAPAVQKAEEASVSLPDPTGPSVFNAIQEQLGLRLVSKKSPVETLVVERIERPIAN